MREGKKETRKLNNHAFFFPIGMVHIFKGLCHNWKAAQKGDWLLMVDSTEDGPCVLVKEHLLSAILSLSS